MHCAVQGIRQLPHWSYHDGTDLIGATTRAGCPLVLARMEAHWSAQADRPLFRGEVCAVGALFGGDALPIREMAGMRTRRRTPILDGKAGKKTGILTAGEH